MSSFLFVLNMRRVALDLELLYTVVGALELGGECDLP
jgi:hypothetical protein